MASWRGSLPRSRGFESRPRNLININMTVLAVVLIIVLVVLVILLSFAVGFFVGKQEALKDFINNFTSVDNVSGTAIEPIIRPYSSCNKTS